MLSWTGACTPWGKRSCPEGTFRPVRKGDPVPALRLRALPAFSAREKPDRRETACCPRAVRPAVFRRGEPVCGIRYAAPGECRTFIHLLLKKAESGDFSATSCFLSLSACVTTAHICDRAVVKGLFSAEFFAQGIVIFRKIH